MRPQSVRKTAQIQVAKLKPHPRQAELFDDLADGELESLAADLEQRGLQSPIHVLPDHTIIRGHQRVRAARTLHWTTIEAVVRHDLADASDEEIEADLIGDNIYRRQLGPVDMVRLVMRLHELAKSQGGKLDKGGGLLRDQIGRRIGRNGRMVGRYVRAAKCHRRVLKALAQGQVTLEQACKLASCQPAHQEDFVKRIESGARAKDIIGEYLPTRGKSAPKRAAVKYPTEFIARLEACLRELEQAAGEVTATAWSTHSLARLKNVRIRLKRVSTRIEARQD